MAGNWAADSVDFVSSRALFSGTGEGTFSPQLEMTRGMLATVLHRLDGAETPADIELFADVDAEAWYAQAVAWAAGSGIVTGDEAGQFNPEAPVTRAQLAVMLCRYAGASAGKGGELAAFADGDSVPAWAHEAMSWAVEAGIITGKDGGRLDPEGTATRAEVAAMFQRFVTHEVTGGKTA